MAINYTQENELTLWWKHKGIQLKSDAQQKTDRPPISISKHGTIRITSNYTTRNYTR